MKKIISILLIVINCNFIYSQDVEYEQFIKKLTILSKHQQDVRFELSDSIKTKYGNYIPSDITKDYKDYYTINEKNDSLNTKLVTDFLTKYKVIDYDKIGFDAYMAIYNQLMIADVKIMEKYSSLIEEILGADLKNNGVLIAKFKDRIAVKKGLKQRYGTQVGIDMETRKCYVLPVEDAENINKIRQEELLLPDLSKYLMVWFDFNWDVVEYKKSIKKSTEILNSYLKNN